MVFGLEFNDSFDLTVIGTLALALATFVSLFFARSALKKTQEQIKLGQEQLEQTQQEIALSRKEVEEAHRPVVVPVIVAPAPATRSVISGRRTLPRRPYLVEPGVLAVPVQNIGSGPALNVEASVKRVDAEGNPWTGPIEPQTPGTVAGIGKDQIVPVEIHAHGWEERWSFDLILTYEDVAGKEWVTKARYRPDRERYESLTINLLAEGV